MTWETDYATEKAAYSKHLPTASKATDSTPDHAIRTSPLLTLINKCKSDDDSKETLLPQFGLLGVHIGSTEHLEPGEPILQNVAAPYSTFICGSQGSGKSYTLAAMLENCLLHDEDTGMLPEPITGLVFHYDADSSGTCAEVARLCSRGIKVRVLVSESNAAALGAKYKSLHGAEDNLEVKMLRLKPAHLTVERMLKLMAVSDQGPTPLYLFTVRSVLRDVAIQLKGQPFDYQMFKAKLKEQPFTDGQNGPLKMRLDLVESILEKQNAKFPGFHFDSQRPATSENDIFQLEPGTLTIIDLSNPFVDAPTACNLFDICFNIAKDLMEQRGRSMIVTLDEAHKFMNQSDEAATFADRLLTTVREQRHKGIRVVVATQEPTISPRLLDLCDVSIVHFFKSPEWFDTIKKHLSGASSLVNTDEQQKGIFKQISALQVGESLVFAPSSYLCYDNGTPKKLGTEFMKMKTRLRKGEDGGETIVAGGNYGAVDNILGRKMDALRVKGHLDL